MLDPRTTQDSSRGSATFPMKLEQVLIAATVTIGDSQTWYAHAELASLRNQLVHISLKQ